jgi:CubicO group peptidase (beta-lactamase class C family)
MPRTAMMAAFPAPDELQVTLANWMIKPFNEWGFRNVRQILPTANIGRSRTSIPLQLSLGHLEDVRFEGLDGTPTTLRAGVEALEVDGLIVLHRGKIVWELYDHGFAPSMQHIVFSVTKSFTGTLAGILTDLGKIHPDDSVPKYIPEGRRTAYGTARVHHLLDMSVGIHFDEDYLAPDGDVSRYRRSAGWSVNEVGGLAPARCSMQRATHWGPDRDGPNRLTMEARP